MIESTFNTVNILIKILCVFLFLVHLWRFETRNDIKSGFFAIIFAIFTQ